ncbi:MAG: hypothetical protein V4631_20725 [Pseudomonadota bacterium]
MASLLLLVCFVLPLSKCENWKKEQAVVLLDKKDAPAALPDKNEAPVAVRDNANYLYADEMALDALKTIGPGNWSQSLTLLGLFSVFFVPAVSLLFKERRQQLILFCSAFPSYYCLYYWVIASPWTPQIGGILAVECWTFLLLVSTLSLLKWWRPARLAAT